MPSESDALAFLERYGYEPSPPPGAARAPISKADVRRWVDFLFPLIYQWAFGEPAPKVGGIDRLLTQARCSLPDPFDPNTGRFVQAATDCRWPHKAIRFAPAPAIAGVAPTLVDQCWADAIASWREVCGIVPVLLSTKPNIWATGQGIDGSGRVLAWSMLPCGMPETGQCEQRYDTAEGWTRQLLTAVMAHEIGHALGLEHDAAGTLMAPYVSTITKPQARDIAQVQARYGPPATPVPVPTPTPEPTPTPGTTTLTILAGGKRWVWEAREA